MTHYDDVTDAYGQLVPVTVSDLPTVGDGTDWDPATLAAWNNTDDPGFSRDLRLEHYTEQVVAALHGDPAVLTLDPLTQDAIGGVGRVFEHIARHINAGWDDPKATGRRAAVLLMADPAGPTPIRCPSCERIHFPLTGPADWAVAGREDILCPPCWASRPRHAAKAVTQPVVKAQAKVAGAPTPKRRPRRRPAGGA